MAADLSKAKDRLSQLQIRVGINFARTIEFVRLANGGIEAIKTGVYQMPEVKLPNGLSSEMRQILENHMTDLRLASMHASADAAILVFAHAILDDVATECCKISATADPLAWEGAVIKKEVSLSKLKERPFDEVVADLVHRYVVSLERVSLADRIDTLHQVCPPSSSDVVFPSVVEMIAEQYKYDGARIRAIDKTRQNILHRVAFDALAKTIEATMSEITYIERSCYYLLWLVDQKHQLGTMEISTT